MNSQSLGWAENHKKSVRCKESILYSLRMYQSCMNRINISAQSIIQVVFKKNAHTFEMKVEFWSLTKNLLPKSLLAGYLFSRLDHQPLFEKSKPRESGGNRAYLFQLLTETSFWKLLTRSWREVELVNGSGYKQDKSVQFVNLWNST